MGNRRVMITEFGGPEVLKLVEEATLPEPGPGEVRVRVQATTANFTDTMVRKGVYYGLKDKPPFPPGYDMVGVVDKLGEGAAEFEVGQVVADLPVTGTYADYVCRPESSLVPVPDGLDPGEAVSLVLAYVTAYQMLHRAAKVQRGQSVLVHAAGGAVGTAMLQLGGLAGLEMYGTASKSKHELVAALGATPIDYRSEDFVARTRELTEEGVDAVFDPIGGENFKRSFKSLKSGGTLVAFGYYDNAMSKRGSVPVEYMRVKLWNLLPNGRSTAYYSIGASRDKHPEWFREDLTKLFRLLAAGKIRPVVAQRMGLEDAVRAHRLVEQAAVSGRIVLMVDAG